MRDLPLRDLHAGVGDLAYGCMRIGGSWDATQITAEEEHKAMVALDAAFEVGVRVFDHADIYCRGKSEEVFGRWLQESGTAREDLFIQSKCAIRFADSAGGDRYDLSTDWVRQSVEGILKRLRVDYLDALLLHRPDPLLEIGDLAPVIAALREEGIVRAFGVSNMPGSERAFLESATGTPMRISQMELSLARLDWLDGLVDFNTDRAPGDSASASIRDAMLNRVQLQAWGALGQGWGLNANGHGADAVASIAELASAHGVSPEAVVLAFLGRHPAAIQPVIGTTDPERIRRCAEMSSVSLSREEWYRLYTIARGEKVP